jgi:cytochrome P450
VSDLDVPAEYAEIMRPQVRADPYQWYASRRSEGPVQRLADGVWIVLGYEAVIAAVRDPLVFSSAEGMGGLMTGKVGPNRVDSKEAFGLDVRGLRVLIASDPPDHTRLRRLLSRAFTPRAVTVLEPRLRRICDSMVDDLIEAGPRGDLVAHLAYPFPVTVIAELLGIPAGRRDDFKRWSDALVGALIGGWDLASAQQPIFEMFGYLDEVVAERQARPSDDLIGRLVAAGREDHDGDEPLSPLEITMFAILLLVAGNETTTNLVGNAFAALAAHPQQAKMLRADPAMVPAVIEETLRYDGPVQALFRGATKDTRLAGADIPAGATLMVCFAAANRDPAHFADPDRFDPERDVHDHLGFGHGIHYCLGASLARLEARIIAESLLQRTRTLQVTGPPLRIDSLVLRGFSSIPVHARAA